MKFLPALAIVLFIAISLGMLHRLATGASAQFADGSCMETGPSGLSQAAAYLRDVAHLPVDTLTRPLSRAQLPTSTVLFTVMPQLVTMPQRSEFHRHHGTNDGDDDGPGDAHGAPGPDGQPQPAEPPPAQGAPPAAAPTASAPPAAHEPGTAPAPDPARSPARDFATADEHPQPPERESALLSPEEEAWVERGGRMVLAIRESQGGLHATGVDAVPGSGSGPSGDPPSPTGTHRGHEHRGTQRMPAHAQDAAATIAVEAVKVLPELPGVHRLLVPSLRSLSGPATLLAVPVFVVGEGAVVLHERIGLGDCWLLSCPEVLTNAHLAEGDHLALLTSLADGRPVAFDEFVHGAEHDLGVTELLRRWHLGPALVLLVICTACWLWRQRTIIGPVADPWRDRRIEAVEGVDAIANLYQAALSPRDCLHLYRSRLLRVIILSTGTRPLKARQLLERSTQGLRLPPRLPARRLPEREFRSALLTLTHAFQEYADDRLR
jgi:hypothetical protein